ncbi:flippase [Flavobacterium gawalongense]|uniref:Flippase n=1 Tax=Flavobacterium gawalongense TaxID=2594432 RepID=A0A553BYR4_9FLAO|nr:flippase [Flavobacterium gawalongense]TRX13389.1 flippase [Flavobacterium gawalongense]TRX15681.1 flippase [Flavobacterium gawalongense]TRX31519.1 flippase [Flavobacterium gawalongense]
MKEKISYYLKQESSKNAIWLILDKILRLGVGLIVGVLVARYLGPVLFGKWNYAIAFISLVSALATLGLDQIVVKHLLDKNEEEYVLLGTAFYLRLIGCFICTLIVLGYFLFFKNDIQLLLVAIFTALNLWFQTFDVIDLKNQSLLQSRKTVVVKNSVFVLISVLRLFFVYFECSLLSFVILGLVECILGALGLILYYGINNFKKWKFNIDYCVVLLKQAWPLILSGIVIMMYMRLDQIMIGEIIGERAVGLYSVSTRFTELWYFIPSVFATSFFPKLVEKFNTNTKNYYDVCLKLLKLLFLVSFSIGVFFTFSSDFIINFLYGREYKMSVFALQISIWTGVFVFWGVAAGNMLVIEHLNKHNLIKSVQGLLLNVILNLVLIPKYGINGAAVATLISQFYASYLYYVFFKKTRHIFLLQTKSILFI